ncbi:MAG TPA: hypothetical protein VF746_14350 [Longimicrobium sp.]
MSAGIASTSEFYEGGNPGTGFTVGASAGYWFTRVVGARLGAAYFTGELPLAAAPSLGFLGGTLDLHSVSAAVELRVRPLASLRSPVLSSAALSAGAGVVRTTTSGDDTTMLVGGEECIRDFGSLSAGACLRDEKTSVQLTADLGADLVRLGGWGLYAEAGLHAYSPLAEEIPSDSADASAARTDAAPPSAARGGGAAGTAVTGRLTVGVRRSFGDRSPPTFRPRPPPPPLPSGEQGVVTIRSTPPGAEVFLVPQVDVVTDPTGKLLCELRADRSPYFRGRTTAGNPVRATVDPQPYWVVVRQGNREERLYFPLAPRGERTENVDMSRAPLRNCPP